MPEALSSFSGLEQRAHVARYFDGYAADRLAPGRNQARALTNTKELHVGPRRSL